MRDFDTHKLITDAQSRAINDVAGQILRYLHERPDARGTLEEIATWWIMQQRLHESVQVVQEAIQQLEAKGLIVRHRVCGDRILYSAEDK